MSSYDAAEVLLKFEEESALSCDAASALSARFEWLTRLSGDCRRYAGHDDLGVGGSHTDQCENNHACVLAPAIFHFLQQII